MDRYDVIKDIGSGNFGVAKLVRDKWTGELYAVKYIERGLKVRMILLFLITFCLIFVFFDHSCGFLEMGSFRG